MQFELGFHTTKEYFGIKDTDTGNRYILTVEILDPEYWKEEYASSYVGLQLKQIFEDEDGEQLEEPAIIDDIEFRENMASYVIAEHVDKFNHILHTNQEPKRKKTFLEKLFS